MDILRCLLLPIQNRTLIVPYAAVAEVVSLDKLTPKDKAPNWLLGEMEWRGLQIPLIHFEKLLQEKTHDISKQDNTRVAVLNRIGDHTFNFMAMVVQEIPRMSRIRKTDLKESKPAKQPLKMELILRENKVFIPDLEWVQQELANALK